VAGPRRLFYCTQLWTGLRIGEIEALEWRDLDLEGDRACVRLRAVATKTKRADVIPLHPDLTKLLRAARPKLAGPTDLVFNSTPTLRTLVGGVYGPKEARRIVAGDLQRAGIPVADEQGRSIDRHALRTTYISWLGVSGVDPRAQIALARHAPTGVTLRHYQDFQLFDLWGEIRKLPPIRWNIPESQVPRATGTCNFRPNAAAPPVALTIVRKEVKPSEMDRIPNVSDTKCHPDKMLENKVNNAVLESEKALEPTGVEPATSWLQTRRSPK